MCKFELNQTLILTLDIERKSKKITTNLPFDFQYHYVEEGETSHLHLTNPYLVSSMHFLLLLL